VSGTQSHFGFEDVAAERRQAKVDRVFGAVASRYDLMNDLMSFGLHRAWKRHLVNRIRPIPGMRFLDLAGGTGDVAFRFLEALGGESGGKPVTVADINPKMLAVGERRAMDRGHWNRIGWVEANAERLPFAPESFDALACAFGMRNVTRLDRALAEANRVLAPLGRVFVMEFSSAVPAHVRRPYDFYSFQVLPRLGKRVAHDEAAYRYLAESIRKFPPPKAFEALMRNAGFAKVKTELLAGGLVALMSGVKV
jgi:demethylmenaquinone methyltransferase / 2-methoxy-6-polyprenyl-1,4-benzoquinol methylase